MEILKMVLMALSMSYFAMLIFMKTPLKERFNKVQVYFICVALYMGIESSVRFIEFIN